MVAISAYRFLSIILTAAFASASASADSEDGGEGGGLRDMWAGMALVLIGTAASIAAETRSTRDKSTNAISTPQVAINTSNSNHEVPPPVAMRNRNTSSPKSVSQLPSESLAQQPLLELKDFSKQPSVISSVDEQHTAATPQFERASPLPRSPPRSSPRRRQQVASLQSSAFFSSPTMSAILGSDISLVTGEGQQTKKTI